MGPRNPGPVTDRTGTVMLVLPRFTSSNVCGLLLPRTTCPKSIVAPAARVLVPNFSVAEGTLVPLSAALMLFTSRSPSNVPVEGGLEGGLKDTRKSTDDPA